MKELSKLTEQELHEELQRRKSTSEKAEKERKRQFEQHKNNFVNMAADEFKKLNAELAELKKVTITGANEMYNRMFEINGKEPKETKSFTLKNADDTAKLTVDRQERFEFTEEATVHINAIKDIFKEKFEGRHKGMYNLIDGLLIKGSKGDYDPRLLAKARRQVRELGDENLINEFDKLDECQRVTGTASYCRLHIRSKRGAWEDVSLQFSSL